MAALKPDQLEIDADGATARPPGTRVIPEPGRYDRDDHRTVPGRFVLAELR